MWLIIIRFGGGSRDRKMDLIWEYPDGYEVKAKMVSEVPKLYELPGDRLLTGDRIN